MNDKNWDSVFSSLLTDVAKICLYNIPTALDSLNIAVVKNPSDTAICQYEVRYFGFGFSSKCSLLVIPEIQNTPFASLNIDRAKLFINDPVDEVFFYEFGSRYDTGNESAKLINIKDLFGAKV